MERMDQAVADGIAEMQSAEDHDGQMDAMGRGQNSAFIVMHSTINRITNDLRITTPMFASMLNQRFDELSDALRDMMDKMWEGRPTVQE